MGYWELENVHASCAEIRQVCIRISYIISNDIFADNEICARFTVVYGNLKSTNFFFLEGRGGRRGNFSNFLNIILVPPVRILSFRNNCNQSQSLHVN